MNISFRPFLTAALLAALLGLSGCQASDTPPVENDSPQQTDAQEAAPSADLDQESCQQALSGLAQYEPGTAGSSLKLYIAAAGLLNFTQTYTDNQASALAEASAVFLQDLDEGALQTLCAQLPAIDAAAQKIIAGDDPSTIDLLEEAGSPQAYDDYDAARYASVWLIFTQAADRQNGQTALTAVTRYEEGTAGSTLKLNLAAARLLNFTQTYDPSEAEMLTQLTDAYLSSLTSEQRQIFADNLSRIDETAQTILKGDDPAVWTMLKDAGSPQVYDAYSLESYSAVKTIIDQCLAAQTA